MRILLILITRLFYVSSTLIAADISNQLVLCEFMGSNLNSTYQFNVNDIPERCNIVLYGYYTIDNELSGGPHVSDSDKDAIRCLLAANQVVYLTVGYSFKFETREILMPSCEDTYDRIISPLIAFLTEFKVSGILLNLQNIFITGREGNPAENLKKFVGRIKKEINLINVGIIINGRFYQMFTENVFDFTMVNEDLNLYVIDLTRLNPCNPETKKTGVTPITNCTDPSLISILQISNATFFSTMMKSKIYAKLLVGVRAARAYNLNMIESYSEYCAFDKTTACQLCADYSVWLYEKGLFLRQYFHGIMLSPLELDDHNCNCNCGQFVATNTIIDGWESEPYKPCEIIDEL